MSDIDFYNWNAHRDYPLTDNATYGAGTSVPKSWILDTGFLFGGKSGFDPETHIVWLHTITVTAGGISLSFKTDAPALADYVLAGAAAPGWSFGEVVELTATHAVSLVTDEDLAIGWVVVGASADFSIGSYTLNSNQIEPATIQSLAGTVVTSLTLYQESLTQWETFASIPGSLPGSIPGSVPGSSPGGYQLVAGDLTGQLYFKDGYNVEVLFDFNNNAITFVAGFGLGDGVFCDWSWDPDMPLCNDTVATIGGVEGGEDGSFLLKGFNGIVVRAHDSIPHTLVIEMANTNLFCEVSIPG